jgi:hypothetical protein
MQLRDLAVKLASNPIFSSRPLPQSRPQRRSRLRDLSGGPVHQQESASVREMVGQIITSDGGSFHSLRIGTTSPDSSSSANIQRDAIAKPCPLIAMW